MRAAAAAILWAGAAAAECPDYVVGPGDSLGRIAREHAGGITAAELYQANRDRIDGPDLIHPGQRLRLPCPEDPETPAAPESPAAAAPDPVAPAPPAPVPTPTLTADAAIRLHLTDPADDPAVAAGLARLRETLPALRLVADPASADLLWPVAAPDCTLLHRLDAAEARLCIAFDLSAPLAQGPDAVPLHAAAPRDAPMGRAALAALAPN